MNATAMTVPPAETAGHPDRTDLSWFARPWGTALMLLVTSVVGLTTTIIIMMEGANMAADPDYRASCDLNPWLSCGTVLKSWQAITFGFSNNYIGLVAFPVLITVAVSLLAGARFHRWYWIAMNIGVLGGFALVVWFWYSAVYSIGTLCLYCMVIWSMVIMQIVLLTSRNIQTGVIPAGPRARALARDLAWPLVVVLFAGIFVSILLELGLGVIGLA
ncbi:vitamin K epoxide reductase family protein [Micrococcus sp.]|uniref:vitamin K epoxide reductase family protein n=1 Tax=Micrococcus sp. TaxID=1271 RepID=UPI002A91B088|nr:vitamin K epoxide reductase family protein [Micrococcus sp.]MDY6055134.1 vitamin K epoxide reductase family protein [Micrococcus sp.]